MHNLLYLLILYICTLTAAFGQSGKPFVLVIDPGHGGRDAGAVGKISKEKDINLAVALAFGQLVERYAKNTKVIYTRKTDVFVPLDKRAAIANSAKADLFISIHTNAVAGGKNVRGAETYTLGMHRAAENLAVAKLENSVITLESNFKQRYQGFDPNKAESYVIFELMQDRYMKRSIDLARHIQTQYKRNGRPTRGVHQAGFLVLRAVAMPSVLTELGYISTPDEERYLNSTAGRNKLAQALFNGLMAYRGSTIRAEAKSSTEVQPLDNLTAENTPAVVKQVPLSADLAPDEAVNGSATLSREEFEAVLKDADNDMVEAEVVPMPYTLSPLHPIGDGMAAPISSLSETIASSKERPVAPKASPAIIERRDADNMTITPKSVLSTTRDKRSKQMRASEEKAIIKAVSQEKSTTKESEQATALAQQKEPLKDYQKTKVAQAKAPAATLIKTATARPTRSVEKKDTQKEEKKVEKTTPATTEWRIQYLSTKSKVIPKNEAYNVLKECDYYEENGVFKHTTGHFFTYQAAQVALKEVRKTCPDAFIVKLVDGKRSK